MFSTQCELFLMLLLFGSAALILKTKKQLALGWGLLFVFFVYIHRILLPFLLSGLYVILISSVLCMLYMRSLRALLLPLRYLKAKAALYLGSEKQKALRLCTAFILLVLLVQLCRVDLSIDYDSIRYGLRSDVLLGGSHFLRDFFDGKGLVNQVYHYPKGFELITLPLLKGPFAYGNVLCFNVWIFILILLLSGETAALLHVSGKAEVFSAFCVSLLPSVSNMSVTAKTDLITLFCQLAFLYAVLRFTAAKGDDRRPIGPGCAALILSYAFKPTALVFSSALGLAALGILIWKGYGKRLKPDRAGTLCILLALGFTAFVTARTLLITGLPFGSVFTGLFEKLGFSLKYPFRTQSLPLSGEGLSFGTAVLHWLRRIVLLLFWPAGEDMFHVSIAWGGLMVILALLSLALYGRGFFSTMEALQTERRGELSLPAAERAPFEKEAAGVLFFLCLKMGLLSLLTLAFLYQVDGNYYGLIDVLLVLCGALSWLAHRAAAEELRGTKHAAGSGYAGGSGYGGGAGRSAGTGQYAGKGERAVLLLSAVLMLFATAETNWTGKTGFTPPDFLNKGYYDHRALYQLQNPLGLPKDTRVVAFAGEPDCYRLDMRVESWVDIDGSGGNVYLTDTILNVFKEYLHFADIDYIYADLDWLQDEGNARHARAAVLFGYLLDDADFSELSYTGPTGRQIYAKIDKDRVCLPWEAELTPDQLVRTAAQQEEYEQKNQMRP